MYSLCVPLERNIDLPIPRYVDFGKSLHKIYKKKSVKIDDTKLVSLDIPYTIYIFIICSFGITNIFIFS